jgi:nicotinamide riboside transporter PnuC
MKGRQQFRHDRILFGFVFGLFFITFATSISFYSLCHLSLYFACYVCCPFDYYERQTINSNKFYDISFLSAPSPSSPRCNKITKIIMIIIYIILQKFIIQTHPATHTQVITILCGPQSNIGAVRSTVVPMLLNVVEPLSRELVNMLQVDPESPPYSQATTYYQ